MSEPNSTPAASSSSSTLNGSDELVHKNRLQEYTQKVSVPMPMYQTINEGSQHQPKFRSTVLVDGLAYMSLNSFSSRKAAEQDVARAALISITKKIRDEVFPLIHKDRVFCKLILNEYAVKMKLVKPSYTTIQSQGLLPLFISSVVINGRTYLGNAGRNKKEAEQLAARAVILSILDNDSEAATNLIEIIKSKSKLYAALLQINSPGSGNAHQRAMAMGVVNSADVENIVDTPNISIDEGKQVAASVGADKMPIDAVLGPSGQFGHSLAICEHPLHFLKVPKAEAASVMFHLPVSVSCSGITHSIAIPQQSLQFLLQTEAETETFTQQPLGDCSVSGRKRNRKNKKKSDKKSRNDASMAVVVVSSPCLIVE